MALVSAERESTATTHRVSKRSVSNKAGVPLRLRLYSSLFWGFMVVSSIALFPVAVLTLVVTWPVDRRRRVLHQFTCFWASLYTWLNPAWPVTIEGRENIRPGVAYVMVSNHQSLLDILVLFRLFAHFKWVSKIENFRVPCIGWNMRLNGYIELRRGDSASILEMMQACERELKAGSSIMMFPEGTRSKDGRLRSFKHGAFKLASRLPAPILPIVLDGTGNALPKAGFILRGRHPIRVRILPEIAPEAFPDGPPEALTAHVRDLIALELGEK